MQIIYRAFDGKEFDNEADCAYHENSRSYYMWDREGKGIVDRTETDKAFAVYFPTEASILGFVATATEMGDTYTNGISGDTVGLYVWDDWSEEYRYVTNYERRSIAAAHNFIESQKGDN